MLGMPSGRIFDHGLCLRKNFRKVEPDKFRTEKPAGFWFLGEFVAHLLKFFVFFRRQRPQSKIRHEGIPTFAISSSVLAGEVSTPKNHGVKRSQSLPQKTRFHSFASIMWFSTNWRAFCFLMQIFGWSSDLDYTTPIAADLFVFETSRCCFWLPREFLPLEVSPLSHFYSYLTSKNKLV